MLIWQLVLIQVVTFVLIIFFLRWLLYGHISRALKRLQQLNRENLKKENVLKEELERAKKEAQKEIEEGKSQAEDIRKQARQGAERERENMLSQARNEAKRLINEAIGDAQRKRTEFTLEMQGKAVYLAADMIKYFFTEENQENVHLQLIDELIEEIEKLEAEKVRPVRKILDAQGDSKVSNQDKAEAEEAEVIGACRLSDGQKKRLQEVLSSKLNRDIILTERIDKEIIAGLVIKLGDFVIDGSIKNKFKKILPLMKEKIKS